MNQKTKPIVIILLMIMAASSCIPVRRMSYVQSDRRQDPNEIMYTGQHIDDIIRPGDELYIRTTSADEESTIFSSRGQAGAVYDPSLLSYTVSEDGTIRLPYIGNIQLSNLTLEEAADSIEVNLSQYLFIPSVFIRFINTKVTVLGEVNSPGVYRFNYKNINILQAIGYANDITEFGNRRNVLIIREEGARKTKQHINLLSDDLLESEWYLIKSNDIIYVEPLKRKKWGMSTVPYNLILSVISTGIVLMTFINTN